jgi:hypothetical protein
MDKGKVILEERGKYDIQKPIHGDIKTFIVETEKDIQHLDEHQQEPFRYSVADKICRIV